MYREKLERQILIFPERHRVVLRGLSGHGGGVGVAGLTESRMTRYFFAPGEQRQILEQDLLDEATTLAPFSSTYNNEAPSAQQKRGPPAQQPLLSEQKLRKLNKNAGASTGKEATHRRSCSTGKEALDAVPAKNRSTGKQALDAVSLLSAHTARRFPTASSSAASNFCAVTTNNHDLLPQSLGDAARPERRYPVLMVCDWAHVGWVVAHFRGVDIDFEFALEDCTSCNSVGGGTAGTEMFVSGFVADVTFSLKFCGYIYGAVQCIWCARERDIVIRINLRPKQFRRGRIPPGPAPGTRVASAGPPAVPDRAPGEHPPRGKNRRTSHEDKATRVQQATRTGPPRWRGSARGACSTG